MKLTHRIKVNNQQWRHDPVTGFLRCTAVILRAGAMTYSATEVNAPIGKSRVRLSVPLDELARPESVTSLEGVPVVDGHTWQTSETADISIGNIAGAPRLDGIDLVADILVTNRTTAQKIMDRELEEISSGFESTIVFEPGESVDGEAVDGHFQDIRYNHVALLPAGLARGGNSVRILNEVTPMDFTRVKLPSGRAVRVHNEDLSVLDEEIAETAVKVDPAPLQTERAALTTQRDELLGQVKALTDQLEALQAVDVETVAEQVVAQREEAAAVMNTHGLKLDGKLKGHALRLHVVNSIAQAKGKPALSDEEAKNEAMVQGMYRVLNSIGVAPVTAPAGHAAAAAATQVQNAAPDMSDPEVRRARLSKSYT